MSGRARSHVAGLRAEKTHLLDSRCILSGDKERINE